MSNSLTLVERGEHFAEFISTEAPASNADLHAAFHDAASDFAVGGDETPAMMAASKAAKPAPKTEPKAELTKAKPGSDEPAQPAPATVAPTLLSTAFAAIRSELRDQITKLHAGCAELWTMRRDFHIKSLSPGQAEANLRDIEANIPQDATAGQLHTIANHVAMLKAISPSMVASASRTCAVKLAELIKLSEQILSSAEVALATHRQQALKSEKAFFAAHGLPHEATSVTKQFTAALDAIPTLKNALQPHDMLPDTGSRAWVLDPSTVLASIVGPAR